MIKFDPEIKLIKLDKVEKFSRQLQKDRIIQSIDYYKSLFRGEIELRSQIFKNYRICGEEFRRTDSLISFYVVNEKIDTSKNTEFRNIFRRELAKSNNFTHYALVDPFGSLQQVTGKTKHDDLLAKAHGDAPASKLGGWDQYKVTNMNPLGWIATSNHRMALDYMGFRLTKRRETIFDMATAKKGDEKVIAILGGSFGSGVYSNPGEEFAQILEDKLNMHSKDTNSSKKFYILNLSQGSVLQFNNFNYMLHMGLLKTIDYAIWIDGLNDLTSTNTSSSWDIDLPEPFTIPWNSYTSGLVNINKMGAKKPDMIERIKAYLSYRKIANKMMNGIGIETINILQPVRNISIDSVDEFHQDTCDKLSSTSLERIDYYKYTSELCKIMGETEYDLEFHLINDDENTFIFWDEAHLAPKGEEQFANYMAKLLIKKLY